VLSEANNRMAPSAVSEGSIEAKTNGKPGTAKETPDVVVEPSKVAAAEEDDEEDDDDEEEGKVEGKDAGEAPSGESCS
jgi:hypothetical protein